MNKKVAVYILSFIAGTTFLSAQVAYATAYPNTGGTGTQWVTDINATGVTGCYTGFDVTDCTAGGGLMYALDTCAVVGDVTVVGSTAAANTATTGSDTATGGYYYNCMGTDTTPSHDNWVCRPDTDNVTNHVVTSCTGAGTSVSATISNGSNTNCLPDYTNCSGGDDGICEIKYAGGSETPYPSAPNAIYTASCSAACDATHLSCTGTTTDAPDDADGCEITENVTAASEPNTLYGTSCTARVCDATHFLYQGDSTTVEGCLGVIDAICTVTSGGLPGTCTGAGTTGTVDGSGGEQCACAEADIPEFATGGFVDATGTYTQAPATLETANPLLWGNQIGTGGFIQLGVDANNDGDISDTNEVKFEVDNTGKITTGFIGDASLAVNIANDGKVLGINASGVAVWMDPGSLSVTGDNLGDHIATENLQLRGNKIIHGITGVNGISVADSTGNVTMDGNLTVATGITVTAGGVIVSSGDLTLTSGVLTASGTGLSSVGGAFTAGGNLTVNGTGISTIAGDLTVSDGDVIFGDTDSAGTIKLSDGSSNFLTLNTGAITTDYTLTFPAGAATDATGKYQVLTANNAGVMSWTNVVPDAGCAGGDVMTWNGSAWACINLAVGSAQTLDVAYDAGNQDAVSRTVTVDGDAVKFNGSHATNDVFQLAQTNASATGDVIDIVNQGLGNAIRINDGTTDRFVVDPNRYLTIVSASGDPLNINAGNFVVDTNGNITITSITGNAIAVNTDEFVIDTDGNTILKQLRLISAGADGVGKPTATCAVGTVGNIAYVTASNAGNYYGCKQIGVGTYAWVSLEVFGS